MVRWFEECSNGWGNSSRESRYASRKKAFAGWGGRGRVLRVGESGFNEMGKSHGVVICDRRQTWKGGAKYG